MNPLIAVVQLSHKTSSPVLTFKRIEGFIQKASKKNANIIVFPENFLYKPEKGKDNAIDYSLYSRKKFCMLARKYKIDIVTGSIIEKNIFGKKYNTSYYINSKGKIKGKYRKINLWAEEKRTITPGKKIKVFNTKYGKIGLIICWDLIFPEVFREMMKKNVQIIFCPAYWCYGDAGVGLKYNKKSEEKLIDSVCIDRAFEEEIILVFCNSAGKINLKNKRETSVGHSQITEPFRGVIKKFNHNREGMFLQKVNTEILRDAEKSYNIKKDVKK